VKSADNTRGNEDGIGHRLLHLTTGGPINEPDELTDGFYTRRRHVAAPVRIVLKIAAFSLPATRNATRRLLSIPDRSW